MSGTAFARGIQSNWHWRGAPATGEMLRVDLLSRLLAARGFAEGGPEVGAFLHPTLVHLHDPSLIPDLDRAAVRILEAVKARERIVIYGDYDVDGVTATAILYHTLRTIDPGVDVRTYVPHRLDEGYGLNEAAIEALAADGARVIVSVDCGITAMGPAKVAKRCGVDLIVTDHHNPPASEADLPEAYAVVHPRRPGSAYPFGDLSGAGVAYKLAWRLATMKCGSPKVSPELRTLLIEMLAFAALGAVADAVPLVGENRVLAKHGLGRAQHSPIEGLRALVEASGLAGENIDAQDAGFMLAPRLNACGRLGHAKEAVELFTTATGDRAREIAEELSKLNDRRKRMEQKITDHACELAEQAGMTRDDKRAIVLADESWHAGVIGIVCSRLVERFHRPTILLQEKDGECHGSGRSVDGFSLHGALAKCASHLAGWGGHDMAAGLRLAKTGMPAFTEAFIETVNDGHPKERLCSTLMVDAQARIGELTPRAVQAVESLEPCGRGNPRARILIQGARLAADPEALGAESKHVVFKLVDGSTNRWLRVMGWRWGERMKKEREAGGAGAEVGGSIAGGPDGRASSRGTASALTRGQTVDVVVTVKMSSWMGNTRVEGELEDVRVEKND